MNETMDLPPGGDHGEHDEHERLRADLARAVKRICPPWLADHADDLVQTALLRILHIRQRSEGNAHLSTSYLRKVAYSALIDEIRSCRRRREVPIEDEKGEIEAGIEDASRVPDPEEQSAGRETGAAIRSCLGRLVRPRRNAVTLHLQGHTVPDIGRLLGWPGKKADNLVYRGLKDLRECLEGKGVRP